MSMQRNQQEPPKADLGRAADFIWRNARLIDRVRFAYLFLNGGREPVLAALRAYQNDDGGFGQGLEPDLRAPVSQPSAVRSALEMLSQVDGFTDPMVRRACDFLLTITTADGGVPFLVSSAAPYPRAPWWQPSSDGAASLVFTAPVVGLLYKHGVSHPWRDRATGYCWSHVAAFDPPRFSGQRWDIQRIGTSYEARALLAFLEHGPDPRRHEAVQRLGQTVLERGLVELDPSASGEVHMPLDYAPSPRSPARSLFSDEIIEAHLDALISAQREDGGWMFRWMEWNPASTLEWRGWLTIEMLRVLNAYGRLA